MARGSHIDPVLTTGPRGHSFESHYDELPGQPLGANDLYTEDFPVSQHNFGATSSLRGSPGDDVYQVHGLAPLLLQISEAQGCHTPLTPTDVPLTPH